MFSIKSNIMEQSNNRTIAKNTIFLFVRTFVSIIVTLFTSRIFLNQLGVEDFGIYNLVGGVVSIFYVLTSFMTGATQRFLSVEIGSKSNYGLDKVMNISIIIHLAICAILLIIGEIVGMILLYNYLNIPEGKEHITQVVFHLSLMTSAVTLLSIPYNAYILAKEHMSFFALITIADVILKLLITISLVLTNDKLIVYSVLLLISTGVITYAYFLYCKKKINLPEFKYYSFRKHDEYKKMIAYSSWSFIGYFASATREQGSSVVLNLFYGVALNAAMGISNQVSGVFSRLFLNLQSAFRPQIMQNAYKDKERYDKLMNLCTFCTILLMGFICTPMIVCCQPVLHLWLGIVPEYTVLFVQLMMVKVFISSLTQCITISIEAYAKLKSTMIASAFISIVIIIISYIILRSGYHPVWAIIMLITSELSYLNNRLIYANKKQLINAYGVLQYCWKALTLVCITLILSFITVAITDKYAYLFGFMLLILAMYTIIAFCLLSKTHRVFIINKVKKMF